MSRMPPFPPPPSWPLCATDTSTDSTSWTSSACRAARSIPRSAAWRKPDSSSRAGSPPTRPSARRGRPASTYRLTRSGRDAVAEAARRLPPPRTRGIAEPAPGARPALTMKLHHRLIALAGRLVPRAARAEWMQEWEAELHQRETRLARQRGALRARDRWRLCREAAAPSGTRSGCSPAAGRRCGFLSSTGDSPWRSSSPSAPRWQRPSSASGYTRRCCSGPPACAIRGDLLTIYVRSPEGAYGDVSTADFEFYRGRNQSFSDVLAFQPAISWAITDNPNERVLGTMVSQNYFDIAGVRPLLGTLTFPATSPTSSSLVNVSGGVEGPIRASSGEHSVSTATCA